jgi:hypothetical protein
MRRQATGTLHHHFHPQRAQQPASLCAVLTSRTSGHIKHVTASKGIRTPVIPTLFAESLAVSLPLPVVFNRCGPSTEAMNVSRIRYTAGCQPVWLGYAPGSPKSGEQETPETGHSPCETRQVSRNGQTIPLIDAAPSGTAGWWLYDGWHVPASSGLPVLRKAATLRPEFRGSNTNGDYRLPLLRSPGSSETQPASYSMGPIGPFRGG